MSQKALKHYGVLGMQWGRRKGGSSGQGIRIGEAHIGRVKGASDSKTWLRVGLKKGESIDDFDKRWQAEMDKPWSKRDKQAISRGKETAKAVLQIAGGIAAVIAANALTNKILRKAASKAFDE